MRMQLSAASPHRHSHISIAQESRVIEPWVPVEFRAYTLGYIYNILQQCHAKSKLDSQTRTPAPLVMMACTIVHHRQHGTHLSSIVRRRLLCRCLHVACRGLMCRLPQPLPLTLNPQPQTPNP